MKLPVFLRGGLMVCATAACGAEDFLDQVADNLTLSAHHDQIRARLSGGVDLESYYFQQPPPGLIYSDGNALLNPRLTLFLDAQIGPRVYVFAQARADHGFDPGEGRLRLRLDEYALRFTPWDNGVCNIQIGKFATVTGNWVPRHHSWENPFVTAPLPYENLTAIWDAMAAGSSNTILGWAHLKPAPFGGDEYLDKQQRLPLIWGPSYTSGAAVTGALGRVDYAVECKNAALASRPESWDAAQTQWQHPTFSGRLGYRPDERWNLGFSASSGSYLRPAAQPTLAAGQTLDDYREVVLGQDIGFAWHHLQLWAEFYEARFEIPRVGQAGTFAYYLEAKYKFTPQFFGAVRWNQQVFGDIPDGKGGSVRWGRNVWRIDVAPSYRFTPHTQFKLQYSLLHEDTRQRPYSHELAAQLLVRF